MKQGDSGNKEDKRCRTVRNQQPIDRPCESYSKKNYHFVQEKKTEKIIKE